MSPGKPGAALMSNVEGVQKPSPKVLKLVIAAGAPFV
jgi:hypothetical protein